MIKFDFDSVRVENVLCRKVGSNIIVRKCILVFCQEKFEMQINDVSNLALKQQHTSFLHEK